MPPSSPTKQPKGPPVSASGIPVRGAHFAINGPVPAFSRGSGSVAQAPLLQEQTGRGGRPQSSYHQPSRTRAPTPVYVNNGRGRGGGHVAGARSVDAGGRGGGGGGGGGAQAGETKESVERDFERMMADLEVPSSVRDKMNTMETHVKSAFLKNSQSFQALTGTGSASHPALPPQLLRSSASTGTPPSSNPLSDGGFQLVSYPSSSNLNPSSSSSHITPPTTRGPLGALTPSGSRSLLTTSTQDNSSSGGGGGLFGSSGKKSTSSKGIGSSKKGDGLSKGEDGPVAMAKWLRDGPRAEIMDLGRVKKLRMLLRHESTMWVEVFIQERGYVHLLKKLAEVVEMEWREEQHDDQLLYELLRCVKALSTSLAGSAAIRSCSPNPFVPLTALLFTDKKPGDVPTRQIITELLLLLFDLYPSSPPQPRWPGDKPSGREYAFALPREYETLPGMVRSLLVGPQKEDEVVEFVSVAHRKRVFKTYLAEISDICRDYFWMFCHANGIWKLEETDVSALERPTAPGGATGGVEYEAVNYLTVHFRLINAMARSCAEHREPLESDTNAWRFHSQLFESGFEKILLSSRKASTTYYPHLHLELSRYVFLARQAQLELPYQVQRLIELPPAHLRKVNGSDSVGLPSQGLNGGRNLHASNASPHSSPTKSPTKKSSSGGPGSPRLESGAGTRVAVGAGGVGGGQAGGGTGGKLDDRFVFQAPPNLAAGGDAGKRIVSPAPQLLRKMASSTGLDLSWK